MSTFKQNEEKSWQIEFFKDTLLMKVFLSLMKSPKSAKQICIESEIPLSSVYVILKKLEQKGLLKKSGAFSDVGRHVALYRS